MAKWTASGIAYLVLATVAMASTARADMLFENVPDLTSSLATTSDAAGPQWSADDFSVQGPSAYAITTVTWWGRFSGLTVPDANTSNFVVEFYAGTPGPEVSPWYRAVLGPVERTLVGASGSVSLFEFTAALAQPAIVQAGSTYYFSVYNDNALDDPRFAILWSSTSEAVNPRWFRQNTSQAWTQSGSNVNTAFRLEGQAAVPEPSTLVLLGAAASVGVLATIRRNRNTR